MVDRDRTLTVEFSQYVSAASCRTKRAGVPTMAVDDLSIGLRTTVPLNELDALATATDPTTACVPVDQRRRDTVKFASCVPHSALERMLAARDGDEVGVAAVISEPITLASS